MSRGRSAAASPARAVLGSCLLVASVFLLGPPPARVEASDAPAAAFAGFVQAWSRLDPDRVVALMGPRDDAMLALGLLSPRISGSFQAPQARRTLAGYFQQVTDVQLQNVTPRDQRDPAGYAVRMFQYSYRALGSSATVTRLEVTLKAGVDGRWELASVVERPRPR